MRQYKFKCKVCGKLLNSLNGLTCHVSKLGDHPDVKYYYEYLHKPDDEVVRYMRDYIKEHSTRNDSGCWLWQGNILYNGYPLFGGNWFFKKQGAHRLSYQIFKGDIPYGLEVNHECCIKQCVNPEHLNLMTSKQNIEYYHRMEGKPKRLRNPIPCIANYNKYNSLHHAARELNVSVFTIIKRIKQGKEGYKKLNEKGEINK